MSGFLLTAYKALTLALSPMVPLYLSARARRGKEDAARLSERYGKTGMVRPEGALIWMHAASVGESVMLLPLIKRVLKARPSAHVLVTTGTKTSAQLMAAQLPARALHQFAPIDTPGSVERFLTHWQPDLALWAESEIWPNLILRTKALGIPMALMNARLSEKSLGRWQTTYAASAKRLFGSFNVILPADAKTAAGLSAITGRNIAVAGNLKYAGAPLTVDIKTQAAYRAVIGNRPVWCAASTHEGEDEIILAAHREVIKQRPDALLILVPRHPERGPKLARLINSTGLDCAQSGYAEDITDMTNVALIAAMGQLGLTYRLSSAAFVGGSLLPSLSGHNPLEPARLGSAIITGPHVDSFAQVYGDLSGAGALSYADSAEQIAAKVLEFLPRGPIFEAQVKAAAAFASSQDGVFDAVWENLEALLPPL